MSYNHAVVGFSSWPFCFVWHFVLFFVCRFLVALPYLLLSLQLFMCTDLVLG